LGRAKPIPNDQYPAVVIPYSTADPKLDPVDEEFVPMHDLDKMVQELCEYKPAFHLVLVPW